MKISLSMYFDEDEYIANYPELNQDELITMFKEDFVDTVYKQWTRNEIYEYLEAVNE